MGGIAPANQPRLSFTGSEDGEAETETSSAAKRQSRCGERRLEFHGLCGLKLTEPPYADPPVRWCGRGERVTAPPIPILYRAIFLGLSFMFRPNAAWPVS
jgi:hypothetical protein